MGLLRIGHEGPLFLSRMIRAVVGGGDATCLKQQKKRVIHEGPRRTTKDHEGVEVNRDGIPRSRRDGRLLIVTLWFDPHGTAGQGSRTNGSFPKGARRIPPSTPSGPHPPGARASRPHAVPWVAAQFPCDVAARPSCRWKSHGPGRSRAMAPLPVDPRRGDG